MGSTDLNLPDKAITVTLLSLLAFFRIQRLGLLGGQVTTPSTRLIVTKVPISSANNLSLSWHDGTTSTLVKIDLRTGDR